MRNLSADYRLLERFWRDPPERLVLPNGLVVLLKREISSPVASVQVWVKTGSIHEQAHLGAGLSHFLEHMLFKGTERRKGRELSSTVQSHGGYLNAYTTFDRTVYYVDIPAEHVAVAIDVLADAVLHSKLPAGEVTRERDVILREIDMGRDDPDRRVGEELFALAFREHPYREPIIGHRELLAAVTRDELVGYYRTRYVPNNLVVVLVGDFDPIGAREAIDRHFGSVPRALLAPVVLPAEPLQQARREHHLFDAVQLTRVGMGWPIPGLAHPDAPALDLLAIVLGQGESSLLWQALRDRGRLVHGIDAHAWNPGAGGLFFVSFSCDAIRRVAATRGVERHLAARAARGFPAGLVAKAVRQLIAGEVNVRKTVAGQAARLGLAEVVVGDLDYTRVYFERLRALGPDDLRRVLRCHLVPERLTVVSLNPRETAVPGGARRAGGPPPSAADFSRVVLPNGARLLCHREARLPSVHLRLLFQGGPLHEPGDRRGATQLLATLLTKDTRRHTAAEVARIIEGVGGSFYPFCGNSSFGLAIEVLRPDVDLALDLLAEAVLAPAFRRSTFDTERDAQLADLQDEADDVVAFGQKRLRRLFFGGHPFAVGATGDEAGLKALKPSDLTALHRRLVVAGNAVLAVTGDFSPRELEPRLRRFLSRLPSGSLPDGANGADGPARVGEFVEHQPRLQAVVYQAYPGPGLFAPDFYVSEVADELFSGMSSRLFERVREDKGLAYFVRSARVIGLRTAMFYFLAGTAPPHAASVVAEINAEVARVARHGVSAAELLRCQTRLRGARRLALQSNSSRAMQAGLNALYGLPRGDWLRYDTHIEAVTAEAVREFARRYLRAARRTQLIVTPA